MNKKITLKTISIKDLWSVLRGCWIFMIIAAVIVTAVMYIHARVNYSPIFSSTATLYLLGQDDGEYSTNQWTVDYTLANVVIDDSKYLLTSRPVLDKVGNEIGVSNGYSAFGPSITINNPEGTRVLEVTAYSSSPDVAKAIVDGICRIGAESINDVLDYDQIQVFEEGTYNPYPSNGVALSTYVKYGAIVAVLIYVVFLAVFLFDTYIHNEEDIERYLGLSVIGDIPDANGTKKKSKYGYRGYEYGKKSHSANTNGGKK